MSRNRIVWSGLDELRQEFRRMPEALTSEAVAIVTGAGEGARAEVVAAYEAHRHSGNLAAGVTLEQGRKHGQLAASVTLRSDAPYAWLFENGSEARHYVTRRGKRKLLGRMPAAHLFVPIAVARRRTMYEALAAMLEEHGLRVSGTL